MAKQKESRLDFIIKEGEGYKIEFKEGVKHLDREIAAFANSSGGSIFIGINDQREVVGITITDRLKSQLIDSARNCDPSIKVDLIPHDNRVLEVQVREGEDKPYRCGEGFFVRQGPSSQKLNRNEIVDFINSSGKIHFDEAINQKFQYPKDFSSEQLASFLQLCGITTKISNKDILLNLNIVEEKAKQLLFTNTAVLFFAKQPQKYFPESLITAVKYQTHDRLSIIDKKDFGGSPIEQIEEVLAFIQRHISVELKVGMLAFGETAFGEALGKHHKVYDYPLQALREAIVNAVVHRDYYYAHSHIYVHIYPDRIDIENPGGLCHGLSIETLGIRSIRRNRLLADLLHRAGYIERVGSGFDRMKDSLEKNNNPPYEITATNFFTIRFHRRLAQLDINQLTPRQLTLYSLLQERKQITKKEAALALNVSADTVLRELKILIEKQLILKKGIGKSTIYIVFGSENS